MHTRLMYISRFLFTACAQNGPPCGVQALTIDIHFRRMIRCMVGTPSAICWKDPWHEIMHIWNQRVREMVEASHIKTWAENCASQHWKFACYIMSLPHERWVCRMLEWQPFGRRLVGRPAMHWASKSKQFSRIKHWYDWKDVAANAERWMVEMDDFVKFCAQYPCSFHTCFRTGSRPKEGCLFGMRASDLRTL